MNAKIVVGIPHTPWIPERIGSMSRLMAALYPRETNEQERPDLRLFTEREPNHVWSEKLWIWAASTDAEWLLQLQDDAVVCPDFWGALDSMLRCATDAAEVIGLEAIHPAGRGIAETGGTWYTTNDALVGVGYLIRIRALRAFLAWRSGLESKMVQAVGEDSLLGIWCAVTGSRVWHPVPSPIDHDVSLPSTYGNDLHKARRPSVTFHDKRVPCWHICGSNGTPHFGTFFESTPEYVRALGDDVRCRELRRDTGRAAQRKLHLQLAMQRVERGVHVPKIMICTPNHGSVEREYLSSIVGLASDDMLDVRGDFELLGHRMEHADVVRSRSRCVAVFLESECDYLLFVDSDVSFSHELIANMLRCNEEFVAAPYPRRDTLDWKAIEKDDGRPTESRGYKYTFRRKGEGTIDARSCVEIDGIGLGCALIKRSLLERMVETYKEELTYFDVAHGQGRDIVFLFSLKSQSDGERRELLGEDFSFCKRVQEVGGRVMMYMGGGSPADHTGKHVYRGMIETFGLRRVAG